MSAPLRSVNGVRDAILLPGVDDDTNRTVNRLLEQLDNLQPGNLLRASYYDGKRAIRQIGTVIPPTYYRLGLVLGWSGKAVDALGDRCNLERVVWPDGDLESLGLPELVEDNNLVSEVNAAVSTSLQHGPAFLVTTRGEPGEPAALIHLKDALNATGDWNGRRRRLDNLLSVVARDPDRDGQVSEFVLYLDGVTLTCERQPGGRWQVDRSEHPWGVPAEVLAYKPQPRTPFGRSRITRPIMSLHDAGLRTVIRMEGHSDVFSFPQMVLLGADESIFKNADGSIKPAWQVVLGRIFGIPDDEDAENPRAQVQQFSAASPEPHLAALNAQAKMFAREANLPDTSVAITDIANPTSAESYDAGQYELIAAAENATVDWGPPLRRTIARALAIQNGEGGVPEEWRTIAPQWRNPRFLSRAAQADAGGKQLAAVPWLANTEVGLELLGLDEQQIRRAMAERRRNNGRDALRAVAQQAAERTAVPAELEAAGTAPAEPTVP